MKVDVRKLYKNERWGWSDYQPMLNAFGKIVVQVDDGFYSGDSRLLYDENGKIGVLIFGWGSCCGCDALQACDSLDEVQELCDELQGDIKWFDDKRQALEYFTTHDWEGDYSWCANKTRNFINKCIKYLSDNPAEKAEERIQALRRCERIQALRRCERMKAWLVCEKDEFGAAVVFAETRGKAKVLARSTEACEDASFLDIEAHRVSHMDKYYTEGKKEMDWYTLKDRIALITECGFHCEDATKEKCEVCFAKDYCDFYKDYIAEEGASDGNV